MPFCGNTTMSKWQTVNEALDLILDHDRGENEKPEEVAEEEAFLHDEPWPNRNFLAICHQILF